MSRRAKFFVQILLLVVVIICAKVADLLLSIKDAAWYNSIISVFWFATTTWAGFILGPIAADIWQLGLQATLDKWSPIRLPGERPIDRALGLLTAYGLTTSKNCLRELDDIRKDPVTGNEENLGSNLIGDLNWIYDSKIRHIRSLQAEQPDIDLVTLRLPIDADAQKPLYSILDEHLAANSRGFVVLGLPGFGKTFSIHKCIVEVNSRDNVEKPMFFFSLSYWLKDKPMIQWMQDELVKTGVVSRQDAVAIIDKNLLWPVFDGLDQVHAELRNQCAKRIFEYSGVNQVIVTSRPVEFEAVVLHFRQQEQIDYEQLFTLIELLPLRDKQLREIINSKMRFAKKREVLGWIRQNKEFAEVIRSPMVLNIVWKIEQKLTREELRELKGKGSRESTDKLWELYDKHIFDVEHGNSVANISLMRRILKMSGLSGRKSPELVTFPADRSRLWLHHLAQRFKARRSIFIEDLQPDFLIKPIDETTYIYLSRLVTSVVLAGAAGFFLSGPIHFLGAGVLAGLVVATLTLWKRRADFLSTSWDTGWRGRLFQLRLLLNILLFSLPVLFTLALFLGLATPRGGEDMIWSNLFAKTEANIAVLLTLFIGVSHGVRESQFERGDIRPVEQIKLNSINAAWFGVRGGFLLGLFLILCANIIQRFGSTFDVWLRYNPYNLDIPVFAMLLGLVLGSPLIGLLKMLDADKTAVAVIEKTRYNSKPNYGISRSLVNLSRGSVLIGLVMTVLLGSFSGLLTHDSSCLAKAVQAGIGASMLASMWFGGFDVINHFMLRVVIYFGRCGPRSFSEFFEFSSRLRLTRTRGASFEFVHPTIGDYYRENGTPELVSGHYMGAGLLTLVVLLLGTSFFITFGRRYASDFYWTRSGNFTVASMPGSLQRLSDSTLLVRRTDILTMVATGKAYLGTFVGYVGPAGTEAGFIGLRLGDTYDVKTMHPVPHGALVVKRLNRNHPYIWRFVSNGPIDWKRIFLEESATTQKIRVNEGDTLQLALNDREWRNNFGQFTINIEGKGK